MNVDYVQPFATAAVRVLESELGVSVKRGKLAVLRADVTMRPVTVLIGISGEIEGTVLYGTDAPTAMRMAASMMGEASAFADETWQSAFAELGNVASGHAAAIFERTGIRCHIAPPSVILGEGKKLSGVDAPKLVIPLLTEIGGVDVAVSMRAAGARVAKER